MSPSEPGCRSSACSSSAPTAELEVIAVGPLPLSEDGRPTFELGVSVQLAELLSGLARLGHRARAIAEAPYEAAAPAPAGTESRISGLDIPGVAVEWFAAEYRSASRPPPADFIDQQRRRIGAKIRRLAERRRPDVVILGRETLAWYALEACRDLKLPTLLIAMGMPSAGLHEGIYPEPATRRLIDRMRQVDMVITVARHLEASLSSLGVDQVRTIPNVVDPVRFRPQPKDERLLTGMGISPDRPVVGSFSSLRAIKRPFDVMQSAEAVLNVNPEAVYLIAGDGPLRGELEQSVRDRGLLGAFRLVGEIPRASVPTYMNLADVVVHASELEGFPLVYREAQACGRPLLASDIPAAREAVIDGESGRLFALGDPADLASKTLSLLHDPEGRASLGRQARRTAEAESVGEWAGRYADALLAIAGRP